MKTNGMGKRILIFALTGVIVLTMQGPRVFAESLQPENRSETSAEQAANQPEITGKESVSQNDLPEEYPESQPVVAAEQTYQELTAAILEDCKVTGMNPPGVTVNLFDYWQDDNNERGEIAHDQVIGELWRTYNIGISKGHLLRFGYRDIICGYCQSADGDFGEWNNSQTNKPYTGIVKNKLGAYGFPELNFNVITDESKFGRYADPDKRGEYLTDIKKGENLSYLFSPDDFLPDYKATYIDVRGLFQPDGDGYYYYNSTENFASYNEATNSFILYNSPGVAENGANEKSRGQFFPFNTAKEVFDSYTFDNGKYHLCYRNQIDSINIGDNSYLKCSSAKLNHYLGMTLEFSFQQPENGRWSNGKPMTFEFSGDDDVWIFIDNVLVADLGGLHNSCSLKIDFSTGEVEVDGEQQPHTLLKSFKDAYGENTDLGGIAFRDNTFADKTEHTFKMFYLERGHGASDLALKFNVLPIPDEPVKKDPPDEDSEETDGTVEAEEPAPDQAPENTSEAAKSIISRSDDYMTLNTTGMPRTGDDSRIEWLIALCIISLSGIGAAVYNLIFVRRKKKDHSSKQ